MSKYYTPEISEFHVGFEYERQDPRMGDDCWDQIIEDGQTTPRHFEKYSEEFRVKYLDREDIESLGWLESEEGILWVSFTQNDYELTLYNKDHVVIDEDDNTKFTGMIRNKSELKMIMKMIGI